MYKKTVITNITNNSWEHNIFRLLQVLNGVFIFNANLLNDSSSFAFRKTPALYKKGGTASPNFIKSLLSWKRQELAPLRLSTSWLAISRRRLPARFRFFLCKCNFPAKTHEKIISESFGGFFRADPFKIQPPSLHFATNVQYCLASIFSKTFARLNDNAQFMLRCSQIFLAIKWIHSLGGKML